MVWDFITFSGEIDLLDLRLNYLNKIVDRFVISEGLSSFTGQPKPLTFNPDKFKDFTHKIKYIPLEPFNFGNVWANEFATRNAAIFHLKDRIQPDDIICFGDSDELIRPEVIEKFDSENPAVCLQHFCYYKVNWLANKPQPWPGTIITKRHNIQTSKDIRNITYKHLFFQELRERREKLDKIPNAGFHFSYCLPVELIQKKISSFAHAAILNTPEINNRDYILKCMEKMESLNAYGNCGDEIHLHKVPIESLDLPPYLLQNREKFNYLFD